MLNIVWVLFSQKICIFVVICYLFVFVHDDWTYVVILLLRYQQPAKVGERGQNGRTLPGGISSVGGSPYR